jgi:MoaA/NifB/PqqE/SkfB family radical SAM enzyme
MGLFRPEEVLFSLTGKCNLDCPHCSGKAAGARFPENSAKRFLRECLRLGINRVGFTGGEPFLETELLCRMSGYARRLGYLFDRVMTNGVWYKSKRDLVRAFKKLHASGFDGSICVSVDAFHDSKPRKIAAFINLACKIWDRPDIISIAYVGPKRQEATRRAIEKLSGLLDEGLFVKLNRIDLSVVGRAENIARLWNGRCIKEDYCRGPGNVLYVLPDGSVRPCCGYASPHGRLISGNIKRDSARDICRNIKNNRFISTVFGSGIGRLRRRLEIAGFKFAGMTDNHCALCDYILKNVPEEMLDNCLDR